MRAILTFHGIDDSGSVLSFPPKRFAAVMDALARSGVPVVDLDTLTTPGCTHGVAITFDDGMRSVAVHALPVLKDHGFCAHLYLTTGAVGHRGPWPGTPGAVSLPTMGWPEIDALVAGGMLIENHTHSHPDLRTLPPDAVAEECERADEIIAEHTGRRPRHFAYPFGYYDRSSRQLARVRFRTAVTTELRPVGERDRLEVLPRLDTYYLQDPRLFERLFHPVVQGYLSFRSVLRTLRGTQLVPEPGIRGLLRAVRR